MKIISGFLMAVAMVTANSFYIHAQNSNAPGKTTDSLPAKVEHAEPLYVDLIRDLGARKGEREWNIGMGLTDNNKFDAYTALVEYEFAPVNRLGFEVELPFTFYYRNQRNTNPDSIPGNRLNSLKLATQYSFFVSPAWQTSMAVGYMHEFELSPFRDYRHGAFLGHLYSPFFIVAKRWGSSFHSLIYTGPNISHHRGHRREMSWQHNTSVHYMIRGSRNFIGLEMNKEFRDSDFDMTIRPQLRVAIAENLMIGIVTGIPVNRENERFSSFLRIIYEPGH
ncbi:HAEPLYID family protein [Pedobacter deserti]|uniref:HAEPLYID family protein n=1 Tax=Pedobacter deserti TaxID=2817382 RepID=UPI00210EEDBF|nr:HAEPLYID family protein [Pedobacter sp. SYSU D00382]